MVKRSRYLSIIFCGLFILASILVSCGIMEGRTMTIVMIQGQPEILKKGEAEWKPIMEGMLVTPGDSLRTSSEEYIWMEINDGSVFGLGRETEASLVTLSKPFDDPVTLIDLKDGMVFVTVTKSLGEGSFEVQTPIITAGVVGSKMAVDYDKTKSTADIACLEGTVTGQYGDDTKSPQVDSGYILGVSIGTIDHEYNGNTYEVRSTDEVYNEFNWFDSRYKNPLWGTEDYRYTQESQLKTHRVETFIMLKSITPTPYPTEEPTATEMPTSTPTPDPLAKLRPTITVDPSAPLTSAEEANLGTHDYELVSTTCSGSTSQNIDQATIQLDGNKLVISDKQNRSEFVKVAENVWQGVAGNGVTVMTLTDEGFTGEASCIWVYRRK